MLKNLDHGHPVGEAKEMMKGFERQACEEKGKRRGRWQWAGTQREERKWLGSPVGGRTGITLSSMAAHLGLRHCSLLFPFGSCREDLSYALVLFKAMDAHGCVYVHIHTLT